MMSSGSTFDECGMRVGVDFGGGMTVENQSQRGKLD